MEEVRSITLWVEMDTNKRTRMFINTNVDSIAEAAQLLRNTADDLEREGIN